MRIAILVLLQAAAFICTVCFILSLIYQSQENKSKILGNVLVVGGMTAISLALLAVNLFVLSIWI